MANKKLKKISKELIKASAMHKGQAEKIKKMLKHGGYKSRYQAGGMYASNTVSATGQGGPQSSSNIVYQESDPALQAQRVAGLEEQRKLAEQDIAEGTAEAQRITEEGKINIEQAALESDQKAAMASSVIGTGLEGAGQLGLLKDHKGASSSIKDAVKGYRTVRAANQAAKGYQAAKGVMAGIKTAKTLKTGFDVAKSTANVANIASKGFQTGQTLSQGFQVGKAASGIAGTATQFGGTATQLGATAGKSALGSAAGALNNANVYAMAGQVIGKGISHFADDDDATTWTAGEATGDILGTAGEYAGYGGMIGSIVPGIGNAVGAAVGGIVGAGVGIWKGLAGRNDARKAERKFKKKQMAHKKKVDTQTVARLQTYKSRVRAGEMAQKTYSGYDLGRNVTARYGGKRYGHGGMQMGTPRYGVAA
tara:strand:+ start:2261 stop:3529 length:1269 start_codon:yes stop_codon:yes gene_type:complete